MATLMFLNYQFSRCEKNRQIIKSQICPESTLSQEGSKIFFFLWPLNNGSLVFQIINCDNVQEAARETDGYFIKSGIVTVIKDALIPSGTVI